MRNVRVVRIYLLGYTLLIIGALLTLWQGGVLSHLSTVWVLAVLVVAVGLGILLFLTAGKPALPRED